MKKSLVRCVCCLFLLTAFSSQPKSGEVVPITIDEAFVKLAKKDSFVLLVSREGCEHCVLMHKMLENTIKDHNTVIYNVVLNDTTEDKLLADVKKMEKQFDDSGTTPHVYDIQDGVVIHDFIGFDEKEPTRFWDWVNDNSLEHAK